MNTNPAAPGGQDNTPEARQTGPVAKTINLGLDTAYALICGGMVVACIFLLAVTGFSWPVLGALALFGYFLYRNIRTIVVHRGND
jgi:hypothetical protein